MSADLLREAAERMRDRAEGATPGPWDCWHTADNGSLEVFVPNGTMDTETILEFKDHSDCEECVRPSGDDTEHIASWHPAVAAAVADWLDAEADQWDRSFRVTQQESRGVDEPPAIHHGDPEAAARTADHHVRHAMTVARAYLGRDA